MMTSIKPDCISAYIVYRDLQHKEKSRYLLLRRSGPYLNGTWQMVSGGIEGNEKAWQTALREIQEETGITPSRFYSADAVETFYLKEKDAIVFVPVFVAIVDQLPQVHLSPTEHDMYEWLDLALAQERLVWAEQKRILNHIHEQFICNEPNSLLQIALSSSQQT